MIGNIAMIGRVGKIGGAPSGKMDGTLVSMGGIGNVDILCDLNLRNPALWMRRGVPLPG